jgi:pyruvate dehydrogenase E1 component alpha subunit
MENAPTDSQSRDILERMLMMRRFEETVAVTAEDNFFGHYHLYIGQEATGAAVIEALEPDDLILTTHRNHGHIIGRGADPGRTLAEILGRAYGFNGGRGGTLHLTVQDLGFLSTSAVVGGGIGLAVGAGYALKQAGSSAISVVFFGDGALEEGTAYESLNLASLWSLPILFVCENNSLGAPGAAAGEYPTSVNAAKELTDIPDSLDISAQSADGADAGAVYSAATAAIAAIRAGHGPVFIETKTVRWPGSRPVWPKLVTGITNLAAATDATLILGEHAEWIKSHDPVLLWARRLLDNAILSPTEIEDVDFRVRGIMEEAQSVSLASPLPEPNSAVAGVFA